MALLEVVIRAAQSKYSNNKHKIPLHIITYLIISLEPVVYHTCISYRTHMVHTVRVYAYGMTIRIWYGYLYHMRMGYTILLLFTSSIYIAIIANTVLLFVLDHTAFCIQ